MIEQGHLVNLSYFLKNPKVLESKAGQLQRSIAWETMINRGVGGFTKYGVYFSMMWLTGIRYPTEARLFRSGNFYWRWFDDVVDKDRPLPFQYQSREEFLQSKRDIIESLSLHPATTIYGDRQDILLAHYVFLARKKNIDLTQESLDILRSIEIDLERGRERRIFSQKELDGYFGLLDPACIKGALKVAREDCDPEEFYPLSMAVRTFFNLRDFPKDFGDGLVNISMEDIDKYGVDLTQLQGKSTIEQLLTYEPIKNWYRGQTQSGLKYLDDSKERLDKLKLKSITRFVMWMHFTRPARKNLTKYAQMLAA